MTIRPTRPIRFAFFGTPELAVTVLNELEAAGLRPELVITAPDKPQGRGMKLTGSPVAQWAKERHIETLKPDKFTEEELQLLHRDEWDVFVVAAYGKILPKSIIDLPLRGTLNVHPSLLPRLRGPSPIQSAILTDDHDTGVSIMLLDEKMDHGPIVAQEKVPMFEWPPKGSVLHDTLAHKGGKLLASVIPLWVEQKIEAKPQDHERATFCKKIMKEDGLIDLVEGDPYHNFLKIRAFEGWPYAYTYFKRGEDFVRVLILDAHMSQDGHLYIDKVKPQGKKEMDYTAFLQSGVTPVSPRTAGLH